MTGRIILFGATGYTGEGTAHALVARGMSPVLVARSADRLERLSARLGGLETHIADVARPESLRELVQHGDVLVSTVGPFVRWGAPAIEAAVAAGAVYIDSTGEPAFIRRVFEEYGPRAEATGASLLTAFGYDWVPGSLAGALALADAGTKATRLETAYFHLGAADRSGGTRASVAGAMLEPSFAFRGGRVRTERVGARVSTFDLGNSGAHPAISVGGSEHLTLPALHPQLEEIDVMLGLDGAYVRYMPLLSAVIAGVAKLPAAGSALRSVVRRSAKGSTGGPDEATRRRSSTAIVAVAYAGDGRELTTVTLEGVSSYAFTFEFLAWAATAAATGHVRGPGALGPIAAFGLSELEAGVRAAGIERAE